jgi:hypothetical protein
MKRRGFLAAIASLLASPVLGKVPVLRDIRYELLDTIRSPSQFIPEVWSARLAEKFYIASMGDVYTADAAKRLAEAIDRDVLASFDDEESDMT